MEFHRVILYSEKSENQTESLFFVHDKKRNTLISTMDFVLVLAWLPKKAHFGQK